MRSDPNADLSQTAQAIALGLLSLGTPETAAAELDNLAAHARLSFAEPFASSLNAIEVLFERGTLVRHGELGGFFHQTMFEFAAARGLLSFDLPPMFDLLANRTANGNGDLFVGAVLEQALILASRNGLALDPARRAVEVLLAVPAETVHSIATVAWAHQPKYLPDALPKLREAGASALERAARVIPTICSASANTRVNQLMQLWQAASIGHTLCVVADSLARLALTEPRIVAEALEYLEPLNALSRYDDGDVRQSLLGLLDRIAGVAPVFVRATLVSMLTSAGSKSDAEIDYLTRNWSDIGDDAMLAEIERRLEATGYLDQAVAMRLGRLYAAEWHRTGAWDDASGWIEFTSELIAPQDRTATEIETGLAAAVAFVEDLPSSDQRVRILVEALVDASNATVSEYVTKRALPDLLDQQGAASELVTAVLRDALATIGPAALAHHFDVRQRCAITSALASQSASVIAGLLPSHLTEREWLADELLTALIPLAADQGNRSAHAIISRVRARPSEFTSKQLSDMFSAQATLGTTLVDVFDALMVSSIFQRDVVRLLRIVQLVTPGDDRIDPYAKELFDIARDLLAGSGNDQIAGGTLMGALMGVMQHGEFDWPEYRRILETIPSDAALTMLVRTLGTQQTEAPGITARIEYLHRLLDVDPDASSPVQTRPRNPVTSSDTATAAASALLHIFATQLPPEQTNWPTIRTLALYRPDQPMVQASGVEFLSVLFFLQRLAEKEPSRIGTNLLEYLTRLSRGQFSGMLPSLWENELADVVHIAASQPNTRPVEALIRLAPELDADMASCILDAIAERAYGAHAEQLSDLANQRIPDELREHVTELVRSYDRSFGTREFSEILGIRRRDT